MVGLGMRAYSTNNLGVKTLSEQRIRSGAAVGLKIIA
jgi:hypothetical protein